LNWSALHYLNPPPAVPVPRLPLTERIWPIAAFVLLAVSSFVQEEPAPYDFLLVAAMAMLLLSGTRFPSGLAWPALAVTLVLTGYAIGTLFAYHREDALLYLRTSTYLSVSLLFFAALVWRFPERVVPWLMAGSVVAGITATALALAGYFSLFPGAEIFALYGRASGPFKDPNVFAPSLILPALYLLHLTTTRPARQALLLAPLFVFLLLGIFFSFSRGAWMNFAVAGLVFLALTWSASAGPQRSRILGFTVMAGFIAVAGIASALSLEDVRALFAQRFVLAQEYDLGEGGRFASMREAFYAALVNPLGIGPYQWPHVWGLMPHNVYVNVFISGGVIALIGWLALTIATLAVGFRALGRDGPVRAVLMIALAVFVGHAVQGLLIDLNHWRHFYVAIGLIWGLVLAAPADNGPVQPPSNRLVSPRKSG
jgi:hypothetical protein